MNRAVIFLRRGTSSGIVTALRAIFNIHLSALTFIERIIREPAECYAPREKVSGQSRVSSRTNVFRAFSFLCFYLSNSLFISLSLSHVLKRSRSNEKFPLSSNGHGFLSRLFKGALSHGTLKVTKCSRISLKGTREGINMKLWRHIYTRFEQVYKFSGCVYTV